MLDAELLISLEKVTHDETKVTNRVASSTDSTQSVSQEFCDLQVHFKNDVKTNESIKILAKYLLLLLKRDFLYLT